jgi:hypothetical protein
MSMGLVVQSGWWPRVTGGARRQLGVGRQLPGGVSYSLPGECVEWRVCCGLSVSATMLTCRGAGRRMHLVWSRCVQCPCLRSAELSGRASSRW